MAFFNTPAEAFLTIAAISAGFGIILVGVVVWYTTKITQLRTEINSLHDQVDKLQEILIRKFPGESLGMTVHGNVINSDLVAAGRDGRQE
jgi:hypothetical protein